MAPPATIPADIAVSIKKPSNNDTEKQDTTATAAVEQSTLIRRGVGLRAVDYALVSPGYTLLAHLTSPGTVRLIANDGTEAHRWNLPYRPGRHARILKNGNLAYNGVHPDAPSLFPMWQKYRGGVMQQIDPSGTVVREHRDPFAHHDQNHLDNGEILYTTLEALTDEEAKMVQGGIPESEAPDGKVYADCIKHIDANNNVIWTWKAIEHLDPAVLPPPSTLRARTLAPHKLCLPFARRQYPRLPAQRLSCNHNFSLHRRDSMAS
ncbi:hypothetical protein G7Y89_g13597 [Cudoniella acicularis]|uniref:Uncharacterized protein n=1 Tax=Cudoniella acicularis TaxID=354080 RepID=A0A8H4R886_9HELO|nr:hypothetical protein G7Y89_g13597 [Cudoniella acicularis]